MPFTCTRCGVKYFGDPALDGPRRKVCQLCVNSAASKQRKHAKNSYHKLHGKKKEETERVCEKCGERFRIEIFEKRGRGRSRFCPTCVPSRRQKESGEEMRRMREEMHQAQMQRLVKEKKEKD